MKKGVNKNNEIFPIKWKKILRFDFFFTFRFKAVTFIEVLLSFKINETDTISDEEQEIR